MQGRQLDGDSGPADDPAPGGRLADGVDRRLVVAVVAVRVRRGDRGLPEHVVGVAEAACLQPPGIAERLVDRLPGDELLAHHPHRHVHALADQRLAAAGDQPRQG